MCLSKKVFLISVFSGLVKVGLSTVNGLKLKIFKTFLKT